MLKMIGTFIGIVILAGIGTIGAVYYGLSTALTLQMQQTALAIATNLSDAAVPFVLRKDRESLRELIQKYGELTDVAYTLLEDRNGVIVAHNLSQLPPNTSGSYLDFRRILRATTVIDGEPAFVTRVPLMNGEIGTVHVAIWQAAIQREIKEIVLPIVQILLFIVLMAIFLGLFIARRMTKPILSLARAADQISRGNFDIPVAVNSNNELGELARSMERLRSSLKAAMIRLNP
jgi:HAMP domain-containing protein